MPLLTASNSTCRPPIFIGAVQSSSTPSFSSFSYEQGPAGRNSGGFLCFSPMKKASLFHRLVLPPAVRALWAHRQAEKCFPARTCRAGKRMKLPFAAIGAKLCEALYRTSAPTTRIPIYDDFLHRYKGLYHNLIRFFPLFGHCELEEKGLSWSPYQILLTLF